MADNINLELDTILDDLTRLSNLIAKKERDLATVKEIYISQEGSDSYKLIIDSNIYYLNNYELTNLANQLKELGIFPS